jgi:putative RecB family exonuclease
MAALRWAPWSLSKVKCAQRCPQEFRFRYVDQIAEPEVSREQRIGKAVHLALELVLQRHALAEALEAGEKELLHDDERARYGELAGAVRAFVERIEVFRQRRRPRVEHVEHKLAIGAQLEATTFIDPNALFRGVVDVGFEWGDGELAVVDHKSGLRRPVGDHADQLEGYATLCAAAYPRLKRIWMGVHYVADRAVEWSAPVPIEEVRQTFMPRLLDQIELAARAVAGPLEPRPGPYCEWCSYRKICPAMRGVPVAEPEPEPAL